MEDVIAWEMRAWWTRWKYVVVSTTIMGVRLERHVIETMSTDLTPPSESRATISPRALLINSQQLTIPQTHP